MASTRDVIAPPIFAEDASTTIPPTPIAGQSYRDPVAGPASSADGWPYQQLVNSAEWNQLMFQWSSLLSIIDKKGVLGWTNLKDYEEAAIAFGSDGRLYKWLQENGPGTAAGARDPISEPAYWLDMSAAGQNVAVFTTPGVTSWTVPDALKTGGRKAYVTVIAGGGSGSRTAVDSGSGGGGGGTAIKLVDLAGVTSVSVTVGAGGTAVAVDGAGVSGSSSSFGAYCSASGGAGAVALGGGGDGGIGTGGDINIKGQGGGAKAAGNPAGYYSAGMGGASSLGGGARGRNSTSNQTGDAGTLGAGGSGNVLSASSGAGGAGIVIVRW